MTKSELRDLIREEARTIIVEQSQLQIAKSIHQFLKQSGLNGSLVRSAFPWVTDTATKKLQNLNMDYAVNPVEFRTGIIINVHILNTNKTEIEAVKRKFKPNKIESKNGTTVLQFGI